MTNCKRCLKTNRRTIITRRCSCIAISFANWTMRRLPVRKSSSVNWQFRSVSPCAFRRAVWFRAVCIFGNINVPSPRILDVPSGWDVIAWASRRQTNSLRRHLTQPTGINVDVCTDWIWPEVRKEHAVSAKKLVISLESMRNNKKGNHKLLMDWNGLFPISNESYIRVCSRCFFPLVKFIVVGFIHRKYML